MKKKALIAGILFVSVLILAYVFVESDYFAELLLKHYNGVSYWYIANKATQKKQDMIGKLESLVEYVENNVFVGDFQVQDLPPLENLIRGLAWCDQASHLYIRLIEPLDIRGYLFFLKNSAGVSPHSVAVITPKANTELRAYHDILNEGFVVDGEQGVLYRNASGQPASFRDIEAGNILDSQKKYFTKGVNEYGYYANEARVFLSNTPISDDSKKRQFFYKHIYLVLPEKAVYIYQDLVLNIGYKNQYKKNSLDFLYFKARNYHIYGRFNKARKLYRAVINASNNRMMSSGCMFFDGMMYLQQKDFVQAKKTFQEVINNYADSPWSNLAQEWLSKT